VDLGRSYDIDEVKLWNVTTGNQGQMTNVYVFVSDSPFTSDDFVSTKNDPNVDDYLIPNQLGRPGTVNANSTGRYIRIQKEGQGFITLPATMVIRIQRMIDITVIVYVSVHPLVRVHVVPLMYQHPAILFE